LSLFVWRAGAAESREREAWKMATAIVSAERAKPMENYKNLHGTSNVEQFECSQDFIKVMFRDHSVYVYTNASAGTGIVEHMKTLAKQGYGLNSFIQREVRKKYSHKE
jgi:hypothetical protein